MRNPTEHFYNEIYSYYYSTVGKLINTALRGELTPEKEKEILYENKSFSDTLVIDKLHVFNEWFLIENKLAKANGKHRYIYTLCSNQYELDESKVDGLITCYTDFAGICKMISFSTEYPKEYKNNLIKLSVSKDIGEIQKKAAKSNDCRNKYLAHRKGANISSLNVTECNRILKGMAESGLEFNKSDDKRLSRLRTKLEEQYNYFLKILNYKPITRIISLIV